MLTVTIDVTGLESWEEALQAFPSEAPQALDEAIGRAADEVAKITQNMPPVSARGTGFGAVGIPVAPTYGGTLRQSIHGNKLGTLQAEVVAGTGYATFVHDGVAPFELNRPVYIDGIGWRYIGQHPGMPPRPYFTWALENYGGDQAILDIIEKTLDGLLPA